MEVVGHDWSLIIFLFPFYPKRYVYLHLGDLVKYWNFLLVVKIIKMNLLL